MFQIYLYLWQQFVYNLVLVLSCIFLEQFFVRQHFSQLYTQDLFVVVNTLISKYSCFYSFMN